MDEKVESFWEKDLQLHYDCCVAVGLIGGLSLGEALSNAESVRTFSGLPLLSKPAEYYIDRYKEYCCARGIKIEV
jgi:hypothetical protein